MTIVAVSPITIEKVNRYQEASPAHKSRLSRLHAPVGHGAIKLPRLTPYRRARMFRALRGMMRVVRHEAYVGLLLTSGTARQCRLSFTSLSSSPSSPSVILVVRRRASQRNTVAYFLLRFSGCATNTAVYVGVPAFRRLHSRCYVYDVAYNLRSRTGCFLVSRVVRYARTMHVFSKIALYQPL